MAPKMRRPAAKPAAKQRMRRPAAAIPKVLKRLREVAPVELPRLGSVRLEDAVYYGKKVEVVGRVVDSGVEANQFYLHLEVSGTQDDGLLRSLSGKRDRRLKVHVCGDDCNQLITEEFLAHGDRFEEVDPKAVAWYTNLVEVVDLGNEEDELARLRARGAMPGGEAEEEPKGDRSQSPKTKKEKKKEKKKDKGKKDKEKSGKEKKEKESKKRKKEDNTETEEELEVGQKSLSAIYADTGLDPDTKTREKILRRAQRTGQKKKKKKTSKSGSSSSSGSSGTGGTAEDTGTGLFSSERRMMSIWRKYPGALACSASQEARQHLISASGVMWGMKKKEVAPVFTHYVRQVLTSQMSPPMMQEAVTLGQALDYLVQGHIAATCDILSQRLKALEAGARGAHWTVSRQMELIKAEAVSIAEDEEARQAAKRAREEERLRGMVSRPQVPRGPDANSGGKGGRKGKDWRGGKNKSDDNWTNKGDKSGEDKGGWQKKDKA